MNQGMPTMQFNSFDYLWLLTGVTTLYFTLPYRMRWVLLLAAIYFFYMCWSPSYVILILLSTGIDYWAALRIGRIEGRKGRRKFLLISLFANLGLLFTFKYYNFFNGFFESLLGHWGANSPLPVIDVLLPVGISFYTFQTLSYMIDVYRGNKEPEGTVRSGQRSASCPPFWTQSVAMPDDVVVERALKISPYGPNFLSAMLAPGLR